MKKWFFLLCLFSLMSCEYKKEWRMSVSAPQHYGATIEAQYYLGEELLAAIKGAGSPGWGLGTDGLTMGEHDKKPIPDRVKIHCYSAREGVNYTADIPLPKKKIEELFKKTINDTVSWGEDETKIIDNSLFDIMCGCAPGGEIVIWLSNGKQLEEVTRVKGKEINRENQQQREAYFNNKSPKEQEWITNNPIPYGTWDKYDKEFLWKPVILADTNNLIHTGNGFMIHYVNGTYEEITSWAYDNFGENNKELTYPTPKNWEEIIKYNFIKTKKRSIPYYIKIQWTPLNDESIEAEVLLPVKQLKLLFEEGYVTKNKKRKFTKLVFDVKNDKMVKIWLIGDDGNKVFIKEVKGEYLNYGQNN